MIPLATPEVITSEPGSTCKPVAPAPAAVTTPVPILEPDPSWKLTLCTAETTVLPPIATVVVEDWPSWDIVAAAVLGPGEGVEEKEVED